MVFISIWCSVASPSTDSTPPQPIWYPSPVGVGGWWGGDNGSSNIACNTGRYCNTPVAWKLLKQENIREVSYIKLDWHIYCTGPSPNFTESMVLVESMVLLLMDKKIRSSTWAVKKEIRRRVFSLNLCRISAINSSKNKAAPEKIHLEREHDAVEREITTHLQYIYIYIQTINNREVTF